ncbi:hypothetical protein [Clostridium gelidum]|nr:hypothetical protein [Clostridium gelidum]
MMFNMHLKSANSSEGYLDKIKERQVGISSSRNCSEVDCNNYGNTITFVAYARVPEGYIFDDTFSLEYTPEFMCNSNCLKCLVEPCVISDVCVTNPCDDTKTIEGCCIKLNKIRLLGSLKYYVDVYFATGNPGVGIAAPGNEGVYFINQILDYTCACNDVCPETITITYDLTLNTTGPLLQPNGDTLVPIDVTLIFTL